MAKSYITQEVFEDTLISLLRDRGYETKVIEFGGKLGPERKLVETNYKHVSCAAAIRLDELYTEYMKRLTDGRPIMMEDIINQMIKAFNSKPSDDCVYEHIEELLFSWDAVKPRLFLNICNRYRNHDYIKGKVFEYVEDLALVPKICIENSNNAMFSCLISESLLGEWGVTKEKVLEEAKRNSENIFPALFGTTQEIAAHMMKDALKDGVQDNIPIALTLMMMPSRFHVVTTTNNDTAAALFYDGMLDKMSKEFDGFFFIIPSSSREFLIMTGDNTTSPEELSEMIRDANKGVAENEILSDHAYVYKNGKFSSFV